MKNNRKNRKEIILRTKRLLKLTDKIPADFKPEKLRLFMRMSTPHILSYLKTFGFHDNLTTGSVCLAAVINSHWLDPLGSANSTDFILVHMHRVIPWKYWVTNPDMPRSAGDAQAEEERKEFEQFSRQIEREIIQNELND